MIINAGAAKVILKPGKACYLYSMGDVGFSGVRHCAESFDDDLGYLRGKMKQGHEVRIFGTGDYLAATSPSERAALISAKGGEGMYKDTLTKMDESVLGDSDKFVAKLMPFKGKILFLESGHHFYNFSRWSIHHGSNNEKYIAKQLGCQYAGMVAYVDLQFPAYDYTARILAYHGNGAGQLPGTGINRRYRAHQAFRDCDFVFAGHDNNRAAATTGSFNKDAHGKPVLSEQRSVCIGAHEIAYALGPQADDYVEIGVMRPSTVGNTITLFEPYKGKMRPRCLI